MRKVICLIGLILIAGLSYAEKTPIAMLSSVRGKVFVVREGAKEPVRAKTGELLYSGDKVKTEAGARAVVNFVSGIEIIVESNTEFTIRTDEKSLKKQEELEMLFGELLSKVPKGVDYRVRTPQAVAAVRGTMFGVECTGNKTVVFVVEGEVEVYNNNGKVVCKGGEKTDVSEGAAPNPAQKIEDENTEKFEQFKEKAKPEVKLKSEKGFVEDIPAEVEITVKNFEGKVELKLSPADFVISQDRIKWKNKASFLIKEKLTLFCMKKNPGPAVLTLTGKEIETTIIALNFSEAQEKALEIELENSKKLYLKFKK